MWYYDHSNNNWCNDIRQIAMELHFMPIYNTKSLFNDAHVYQKCLELMQNEWTVNILQKPKNIL